MKRFIAIILFALPVVAVLVLVFSQMRWKFSRSPGAQTVVVDSTATDVVVTTISPVAVASHDQSRQLLGETILRDYANTNYPPEHDLTLMSRLMENSLLLLKSAANHPLSANEDWADLLRGRNAAQERFLADTNAALNSSGQLIDRWGTPLFFHALGGGRFELRSAGPDRRLWTDDDIHRNGDGSFRHGNDLNPASLLPAAGRP